MNLEFSKSIVAQSLLDSPSSKISINVAERFLFRIEGILPYVQDYLDSYDILC